MTNDPTDAEIFVVAREAGLLPDNSHPAPETRAARKHSNAVQAFARAVLAKWGTPPAVVGEPVAWRQGSLTTVNQDPYPSLGDWFVQFWEGDDVAARVYGNDMETLRRRCAVVATQAQAAAVPLTDREIELIDGMIKVQLDHASRCDAIANRSMADKQKGWDMERVALLQKIKAHGIKGGQHGL